MSNPILVQLLQVALRGLAGVGDQVDHRMRAIFVEMGVEVPPSTQGEVWTRSVRALADTLEGPGGLDRFLAKIKTDRTLNGLVGVDRLVTLLRKK
jgi:hypothetical protein